MPPGVLVYPRWPEKKRKKRGSRDQRLPGHAPGSGRRAGMAPARERRKREKERKRREDRPGAPSLPGPRPRGDPPPLGRARGRDPRAARPNRRLPRHLPPGTPHRLGQGREWGAGSGSAAGPRRGPPPFAGRKGRAGEGHTPSSGDGGETRTWWGAGASERESPRRPPTTPHGRAGAGGCGRASGARPPRGDKPLCRGLTFNRSQRGSCSATYETPTQKQVVYEWFSARFHTNVR